MKEVDKLVDCHEKSLLLSDFLDWLGENGYAICTLQKTGYVGGDGEEAWMEKSESHEQTLAGFFDIDLDKLEKERREILDNLRSNRASS